MKNALVALLIVLVLGVPLRADDPPLVVVAARQYLVQGDSAIHLYLYGLDGKLRKQLTTDAGEDDRKPQFSHDGKSVLFTRTTMGAGLPNESGKYVLQLADGTMSKLPEGDAPNRDFDPTLDTIAYDNLAFFDPMPGEPYPFGGEHAFAFSAPDRSATLIQVNSNGADANSTYKIKFAGTANPINTFAGYKRNSDVTDTFLAARSGPFLVGPDRYGALFVNRHGDSMWAFDVRRKTWHPIQPEPLPGDIYGVQTKAGFYYVRCSLREALGDTQKKPACAYLEWWDAAFRPTVIGPPLSVFYGAATWFGPSETAALVDEQRGS